MNGKKLGHKSIGVTPEQKKEKEGGRKRKKKEEEGRRRKKKEEEGRRRKKKKETRKNTVSFLRSDDVQKKTIK